MRKINNEIKVTNTGTSTMGKTEVRAPQHVAVLVYLVYVACVCTLLKFIKKVVVVQYTRKMTPHYLILLPRSRSLYVTDLDVIAV